jgi:hypothetical protein
MCKNLILPSLLLFSIATLSFSCVSTKKFVAGESKFDVTKVPQGYDPQKHILLIAEMPLLNNREKTNYAVTRKVNGKFKKYFPYRYEIVSPKEIKSNSGKYSDTSVYRYALMNNVASFEHDPVHSIHTIEIIDFGFYDRVTTQQYPQTGNGFPQIKYTVVALTELIKKSKGELSGLAYTR